MASDSGKNTVLFIEPRKIIYVTNVLTRAVNVLKSNWNYVYYCGKGDKSYWKNILHPFIEIRELDVNNLTADEYSIFLKKKSLWLSLSGEYVMTLQVDAWIVNCPPYTIDYFLNLNKSYIGGNSNYAWDTWEIHGFQTPRIRNFNGGLSLRKRKDMIRIIETFPLCGEYPPLPCQITNYPEDVYFTICGYLLNMNMGDDEASSYFSVHTIYKNRCFGMHKIEKTNPFGPPSFHYDKNIDDVPKLVSIQYPRLKYINPYLSPSYKELIKNN